MRLKYLLAGSASMALAWLLHDWPDTAAGVTNPLTPGHPDDSLSVIALLVGLALLAPALVRATRHCRFGG